MQLTDEQLESFQRLYLETFGVPISKKEALVQALALLRLVRVLSRPTSRAKHDDM